MASKSQNRFKKNRKNLQDYPNFYDTDGLLRQASVKSISFEDIIDAQINQAKEERPTVLRSNVVEKYVREILNNKRDP